MSIQISIPEALNFYANLAGEFLLSPIPNDKRLAIVLGRLEAQMSECKLAWHKARQDLLMVEDLEEHDGKLDLLTARLARYEEQAGQWKSEYKSISDDSTDATLAARKVELRSSLEKLATRFLEVQEEIQTLSLVRDQLRETEQIRRVSYEEAKKKFEELQRVGPSLVALTAALEKAKSDKLAALEAQADQGEDTAHILQQLQSDMKEASAGLQAANQIGQQTVAVDIDTVIAVEQTHAERNALLEKWLK